jgi:uncharacterized protein YbjT (DUF2867 family)
MNRTALLAGASGLVGSHCLRFLLQDDSYQKVIALVRQRLPVDNLKLEQRIIDYNHLQESSDLFAAADLFCCLGTTIKKAGSRRRFAKVDHDYVYNLAEIAREKGIEQFILVSSLGAYHRSRIFYNRIKGLTEESVIKLKFRSTLIFRPSLLLGQRNEFRMGEEISKKIFVPLSGLLMGPLKKYKPISAETVARAMVITARRNLSGLRIFDSDEIEALVMGKG